MNEDYIKFIENLNQFINKYNLIVDNYVSKRDFENIIQEIKVLFPNIVKYKNNLRKDIFTKLEKISLLTYDDFKKHNKNFINKSLITHKEYFENIFLDFDENIKLDDEQKHAIIADDDYSIIIAGAGSGKTTTMAAKVKYLVDIKKIDPKEIVVLSYTKKAVNELRNKINRVFKIEANITTFHSLALHIINKQIPGCFSIYDDSQKRKVILKYITDNLFLDKNKLKMVINTFPDMFFKGFIDNFDRFKTFEKYFEDYKKRKWKQEKDHIDLYVKNREEALLSLENPKGLDLRTYKSKTEAKIANFLYKNSIEYQYERPYLEKVGDDKLYNPDFTCFKNGKNIYIEYFGMTKYCEKGLFTKEQINAYNENKNLKIQSFKERNDRYIILERDNKTDELLFFELRSKLKHEGFELIKRDSKEIFDHIIDEFKEAEFFLFTNKIMSVIDRIKETTDIDSNFIEDYKKYLINNFPDEIERKTRIRETSIILEIYNYYNQELKRNKAIDFTDMITKAYETLKNNKDKSDINFKYLLVDEYQDISKKRFLLTKELADKCFAKIVAVGDDWQTIYTFAGSNIELFYNFRKYFEESNSYKITNTYRNSQELIDTAGDFIQKNKQQIPKSLISSKHFENPIEIIFYKIIREIDALCTLLDELAPILKKKTVAILTRRNKTIKEIKKDGRFRDGPNNKIYYTKENDLDIEILTMHSAKGTTFDEVIVLDLKNSIFPTKGYSKSTITDFIEERDIHEYYPHAEERRLFYVALTRTKNKVYLLTPENIEDRSTFVQEIENERNVIKRELIELI